MLPFLFRYDHVNYTRWVTVYLAEMSVLPPEVLHEFQERNFVVKRIDRRFNQVSADQSTEWLNAVGKKSVGLGITRVASGFSRFTLPYNLRTVICSQTAAMLILTTDYEDGEFAHNDCTKGRLENDEVMKETYCFIVETAWRVLRWQCLVEESNQQGCGHI